MSPRTQKVAHTDRQGSENDPVNRRLDDSSPRRKTGSAGRGRAGFIHISFAVLEARRLPALLPSERKPSLGRAQMAAQSEPAGQFFFQFNATSSLAACK